MGKKDPRVDAYIAKQADFAKPVIARFREIVHEALPEITEDIKWGAPAFMHHGIVCIIAGFKQHCAVNFWRRGLIVGTRARRATDDKEMAKFERMMTVADLPSKATITTYVKLGARINEGSVKAPPKRAKPVAKKKAPVRTPPSLSKALARNARAKATYDGFSPSHKREYVEWISEAKTDETRDRRIEQALGWMAEGKPRNWKYIRK